MSILNLARHETATPSENTGPSVYAYVRDELTRGEIQRFLDDMVTGDIRVVKGDLDKAISDLRHQKSPSILMIDVSGLDLPLLKLNELSEVCDQHSRVIIIGENNDVGLYRALREMGISEYLYKPLTRPILATVMMPLLSGEAPRPAARRMGRVINVIGAHGGVGATTIAINLAMHLGDETRRRVALVDLDLRFGSAALALNVAADQTIIEPLANPRLLDDRVIDRAARQVTPRLHLFAALQSFEEDATPSVYGIRHFIAKLAEQYPFVVVDLPRHLAVEARHYMQMPALNLLVSDLTQHSARDLARLKHLLSPLQEQPAIVIANRQGTPGELETASFGRAADGDADVVIGVDRNICVQMHEGKPAINSSRILRQGIEKLSRRISGRSATVAANDDDFEPRKSIWSRILGSR
jgi:pilus assembly protein CpaE